MSDLEAEKKLAAERSVECVQDGMIVGLGSGSTAAYAVRDLGRRVSEGLRIQAIASSKATEALAQSLGIPITSFDLHPVIDVTIDGADEVDDALNAIKGGGGAFLREKIVAEASTRMIVAVDSSKPVAKLGRFPLPLEVLPFAVPVVSRSVAASGAEISVRRRSDGSLVITDQGNQILDAEFGRIDDPPALAARLSAIPGLLAHGLFLVEIDTVVIGRGETIEIRERRG